MKELRNGLEAMNMSLAFDDFGAGQARIAELSEVCPHYVKFDRSLIRAIDQADSMRRRVIKGLVAMVSDIGSVALAEGVETADEARVCADLGFALGQGYYFGKPMPAASYLQHERANCEPANPSDSHLIGEE